MSRLTWPRGSKVLHTCQVMHFFGDFYQLLIAAGLTSLARVSRLSVWVPGQVGKTFITCMVLVLHYAPRGFGTRLSGQTYDHAKHYLFITNKYSWDSPKKPINSEEVLGLVLKFIEVMCVDSNRQVVYERYALSVDTIHWVPDFQQSRSILYLPKHLSNLSFATSVKSIFDVIEVVNVYCNLHLYLWIRDIFPRKLEVCISNVVWINDNQLNFSNCQNPEGDSQKLRVSWGSLWRWWASKVETSNSWAVEPRTKQHGCHPAIVGFNVGSSISVLIFKLLCIPKLGAPSWRLAESYWKSIEVTENRWLPERL